MSEFYSPETSETFPERTVAWRPTLRRIAAAALTACAFALPATEAHALPQPAAAAEVEQSDTVEAEPHLAIGMQDDGEVIDNHQGMREEVLDRGEQLGATWWRVILDANKVLQPATPDQPSGWDVYKPGIVAAHEHGFNVLLAISCNDIPWTVQSFRKHVVKVVKEYGDYVDDYSVCNEPNRPDGLNAMPGLTKPETYRILFDAVAPLLRKFDPGSKVLAFETSPDKDALEFIDEAASYCPELKKICTMIIDGVAHHLYQFTTSPTEASPEGTVGIGSLDELSTKIDTLFDDHKLETPEGKNPQIYGTELSYMHDAEGNYVRYNLPEARRKKYFLEALKETCARSKVALLSFYQVASSSKFWPGNWNSPQLKPNGKPYPSFNTLKAGIRNRQGECVDTTG